MLALSREVISEELGLASRIIEKWKQKIEQGIPEVDLPTSNESALDDFIIELSGELQLLSSKLENMAMILSENRPVQ